MYLLLLAYAANVTTVAGVSGNVTTVAGIASDISTVAADAYDIGRVSLYSTEVNAVGDNIAAVDTVADNIGSVNYFFNRYKTGTTDPAYNAIAGTPAEGDLFYNTAQNKLKVYTGFCRSLAVRVGLMARRLAMVFWLQVAAQ